MLFLKVNKGYPFSKSSETRCTILTKNEDSNYTNISMHFVQKYFKSYQEGLIFFYYFSILPYNQEIPLQMIIKKYVQQNYFWREIELVTSCSISYIFGTLQLDLFTTYIIIISCTTEKEKKIMYLVKVSTKLFNYYLCT